MRNQIAAANWKMNLNIDEAKQLASSLLKHPLKVDSVRKVLLSVPFPYLLAIQELIGDAEHIHICAQNCAATSNGAYTGEVSAQMLSYMGVDHVLVGHSERREYYFETNEILARKVDQAISHGMHPVFCCGESLQIRESGSQNSYVAEQLKESIFHLSAEQILGCVIAYEPIWAIGTGKTATSEQAQEMHGHIRNTIATKYGNEVASNIAILYGGSVKAANAADIFGKPDVDGGLVGGASLNADEFASIVNSLK